MSKLKLELELILPNDASACDACTARLLEAMHGLTGVINAHIDTASTKPRLCLHYDPALVPLSEIRHAAGRAGAELGRRFEHLSVAVVGLRHERQAGLVAGVIERQVGVVGATVSFGARRLQIEFDPTLTTRSALQNAAADAGIATYPEPSSPAEHEHSEHEHAHGGPFGEKTELVFSLACGAMTAAGWGCGKLNIPAAVPIALFVAAYILGAWFTVKEVLVALRARRFEIDFLMLLAALGAALLGEWFEGALLLFLSTLGHALEAFAMSRARNAIAALAQLVPETALLLDSAGAVEEVAIDRLAVGDDILVKPNSRLPADGFVVLGAGSVNQSPITGESMPVEKSPVASRSEALLDPAGLDPQHRVFAGTINGASVLTVVVTKVAAESTIARLVRLVSNAQTQKSPTELFTDKFERVLVPVVLVMVVALGFAWLLIDEPFARSFYRAMAVLVASSPCALAIATPSAVLAGVARAARGGVLVKGGAHLEALGLVTAIAFDKTGTLTEGKPRLTDVVPVNGVNVHQLLMGAIAVEKHSDHPLADAIVVGGAQRLPASVAIPTASGVEAITGYGVRGMVDGVLVEIGKPGYFDQASMSSLEVQSIVAQLLREGRTVMLVRVGSRVLGALGVMDTPRPQAAAVIARIHQLGIKRTIMLTGDNQQVADAVGTAVGLTDVRANLLPEQKVAAIMELARSSVRVAMVGDGVNDAPAMAHATVGIAMGAGGSDVALETADVALMADDLNALPFAVGLSRAARRIIRQNLWVSLGVMAVLVPATILGLARIGVAVALHEGTTVLVVANALRLLVYKERS